eukprot:2369811-Amphidinium_carterae.1
MTPADVDSMLDSNTPAPQSPSQMQQVISTSSLKELQRQGSFITSNKWSEGYVWMDVADAGDWVLGSIRPTRASSIYNSDNNKVTTASTLWHIHRDATFALASAYYHTSMLPEYGQQQPTAAPAGEAAAADATAGQQQPSSS